VNKVPSFSERLSKIAGFVTPGVPFADIGSDHALVPMNLLLGGVCPVAIVTDVNEGPIETARLALKSFPSQGLFDLRLGDGLEPIAFGEVDTVVIAGMGGETIVRILSDDVEKSASFPKYVLSPMTNSAVLRKWIATAGWYLIHEDLARERERIVEIMVATPDIADERLPEEDRRAAVRFASCVPCCF